ncbi:hypothetical protein F5148DRAFT_978024 [Russula earlei]|uniref:Uncharacterized protein n=1 Tax=Russula earlei TaxID=71964 RepID=A0ACC0UDM9_9AGAM|nr:hypothetical protein F5148DRAFT_978024 [Russula earlei]
MFARPTHTSSLISRSSRSFTHATAGEEALDRWAGQKKGLITLSETLHTERVSDLYITLPTRDGTRRPYSGPMKSGALGFGHHLAFFHPRTPERLLRSDGMDPDFCPPEPFVRRMWAGGRIEWRNPLIIGGKARALFSVSSVDKKAAAVPMVFVSQRIEIANEGEEECAVLEERTHVYRAPGTHRRTSREGKQVLDRFTPSPTTLFRFSALTFNGHRIHLDRDYAQEAEGHAERLVHGPLMALMLLETFAFYHPKVQMKRFEYQALNPVIVDRELTFHWSRSGLEEMILWVQCKSGTVGMKGKVTFEHGSTDTTGRSSELMSLCL